MIRHAGSSAADLRTTLILLCEDGSLRIYMANVDHTNFWMVPTMQPGVSLTMDSGSAKLERKKKLTQTGLYIIYWRYVALVFVLWCLALSSSAAAEASVTALR